MTVTVVHSHPVWLPLTETWLHGIVAEQQRGGVSAHVVCRRRENLDRFPIENLHAIDATSSPRQIWERFLARTRIRRFSGLLVQVGREVGADLIHSHFGNVGWMDLGAVEKLRVPHIVTFYGLDASLLPRDEVWRKRYQRLFAKAQLFLCEGPHMAETLASLGCPRAKLRVQHLGIRVEDIPFVPRKWVPGEPLRILIAATFREKKGIPDALEAVGRLQHSMALEVTVIGGVTSEARSLAERDRIERVIARHNLGAKVRFLGFQSHSVMIAEAYRHHLFLSPSVTAADGDTEGGAPVSIIEMAASGMPVIGTTHCDIPEVLKPEASFFLASEHDVDGLVSIARRLTADWESLEPRLRSLRAYIEREFDLSTQAARMKEIYQSVL